MTKIDDLSEAIGQLRADVRAISAQQTAADSSRARIYDKLEILSGDVRSVKEDTTDLTERITKIEPTVAEISKWRERGVGALMLVSFAAAAIGGALATFGKKLWALIAGP